MTTVLRTLQLFFFLLIFISGSSAQEFWTRVPGFPKEPTTGIGAIDHALYVSTPGKVLKRASLNSPWTTVLNTSDLRSLYVNRPGNIIAGSKGKIHTSTDAGSSWKTGLIDSALYVKECAMTSDGDLFALAVTESTSFPAWSALYASTDGGTSWTVRISGKITGLVFDQLDIDASNRLYLTSKKDNPNIAGGLFTSDDKGANWKFVPLVVDGRNIINDQVSIDQTSGLDAGSDTVYMSQLGIAGNVLVRLNVKKKRTQLDDPMIKWTIDAIATGWWMDRTMNDMFIASNGDRYSSSNGSPSTGATFYLSPGSNWQAYRNDLLHNNIFRQQYFAETTDKRVYMVHQADSNLYQAPWKITTSLVEKNMPVPVQLSPNPARPLEIISAAENLNATWRIHDLTGQYLSDVRVVEGKLSLDLPPGLYYLVDSKNNLPVGKIVLLD